MEAIEMVTDPQVPGLRIPKCAALSPRDLAEDQGYLNNDWVTNEKLIGIGTGGRRPIDCRIVFRL